MNGVEVDFRKIVAEAENYTVFVSGNTAFSESDIDLSDDAKRFELKENRDLQGHSPFILNLQLGLDHHPSEQKFTLLLASFDDKIYAVGRNTANEIEAGRITLDLTYEKIFTDSLSLKAKVKNLLDEPVEFERDGHVIQVYKNGTEFSVDVTYDF